MGEVLTLKVITQDGEMMIKIRDQLTVNNLKLIVVKKLMNKSVNTKLLIDDNEMIGHKKLRDIGLANGATLEARVDKAGGQIKVVKDNKDVRPGEEQHYNYS